MSSAAIEIQDLLALQSKVGRPSQAICTTIGGLKDLCDLQGGSHMDWRRGTGGSGSGGHHHHHHSRSGGNGSSNSSGSSRPMFRNGSGSSLSSSGSSQSPRFHLGQGQGQGQGGPQHHQRYQSRFKNSTQPVEDKILNNIILSKLNKFSGSTYDDIRDFLYQILGSGEPDLAEMIRHFMLLVFKKAAAEETYCPLYAKLLAEISSRYAVILEEMKKLQAHYLEIFDDIEEVPEGGENYDTFVQKKKEKMYRQGYSQFLAELAGLEILELKNLEQTFEKLFGLLLRHAAEPDKKALIEDYTDCLVRMSKVLKKKSSPFFFEARATLWRTSKEAIETLLQKKGDFPSLSPKAKFLLMDVKDNLSC